MKGFQISCPECGTAFDLLHALEDGEARRFMALVGEVPPMLIKPVLRYLKLFRPAQQALRWSRLVSLLQELLPMMQAAEVQRGGITHVMPHAQWAEAMTQLVETPPATLQLPLKGHGYLLSILAGDTKTNDPLYAEACAIVRKTNKATITNLQRALQLGYNRAARLIEAMETDGIVSPMDKYGARKLLTPND